MIEKKIQNARVKLLHKGIRKSGLNRFANYQYFELADFLPAIQEILHEEGLFSEFVITGDTASLKIIDTEKKEEKAFIIPAIFSKNDRLNPIQELGATITYLRRYLWLIAFEITETEEIDRLPPANNNEDEKKEIENLFKEFLALERIKDIPIEKRVNILQVKKLHAENRLKLEVIKNAIEYLNTLENKEEAGNE